MKCINLLFVCFVCLLITLDSFGCEYNLRSFYKIGAPFGGINRNNYKLQNPPANTSGPQFEFLCILTDSRFLVGLGYDKEDKKYYLVNPETKHHRDFESDYQSYYLRLGYSLPMEDGASLEGGFRVGNGKFVFNEIGSEDKKISNIYSLALDIKAVKGIAIKSYNDKELKFNLIGGLGAQKAFVPSFRYNDRDFSFSDFDVGINIIFGIGFSF